MVRVDDFRKILLMQAKIVRYEAGVKRTAYCYHNYVMEIRAQVSATLQQACNEGAFVQSRDSMKTR